jgi:diamine N-acetyltransferase
MIADAHQGKGYARGAMELLIEHVRRRPMVEELLLSYVPGEGSPEGFYRGLGFEALRAK